jgi:hypothetical protein
MQKQVVHCLDVFGEEAHGKRPFVNKNYRGGNV